VVPELIEVTVPVEEMLQNCDEQEEKYLPSTPEEMVLKNAGSGGSKETHSNNSNNKKNNSGNNTSAMDAKSEPTTAAGKRKRERSESPSDRPDEEGGNAYIDLLKVP
jgi:hypothetical protein